MDKKQVRSLRFIPLLVCLLVFVHLAMPGCARRNFPPVRDAEAYVLEVYHVEVPDGAGRGHPAIEEVIRDRRVQVLDRYPVLRLNVGDTASMAQEAASQTVHIQAELRAIQHEFATLAFDVQPWERALSNIRLPLDTWGAAMTGVNSDRGTLSLLVFRLNRPAG